MAKKRKQSRSLFDPTVNIRSYYSLRYEEYDEFFESDREIFEDIMGDEAAVDPDYSTGMVAGPLEINLNGKQIDLTRQRREPMAIPGWVEPDALKFTRSSATGVLVIERGSAAFRLIKAKAWESLNLIIVGSCGIPRVRTRRFLHRINVELKLPVFVLADNDLWGYFIFSVLKRGMCAPQKTFPYLSVENVRYLGLRAGEVNEFTENRERLIIKPKENWAQRMKQLKKYKCFQSAKWKAEFKAFQKQNGKYELDGAVIVAGESRFVDYLKRKINDKDWLE